MKPRIDLDALGHAVKQSRFNTIHFEDRNGIYMLTNPFEDYPFQDFWKVSFTPMGSPLQGAVERKGLTAILDLIATTYPHFYEYLVATFSVEHKESGGTAMKFMNYTQACELANAIRQEIQQGEVKATVGQVFPASELLHNRELYPEGSHLVEVTFHLVDANAKAWIRSEEHYNAIKPK